LKIFHLYYEGLNFLRHIVENRYLIYELTKRDFQSRYVQKFLGISWAVLEPLAFIVILWIIFGYGLRGGKTMEIPFIAYLVTGFVSFNLFSKTLGQATNSIQSYSFLVKKVKFRIAILPLVKVFSELFLHLIILLITFIVLLINGIYPSYYWIQLVYYIFALVVFLTGLSWITSSVNVFFPDMSNIIAICTRFLFYLTPIFWDIRMLPERFQHILKLNPLFYIVNGYRDSLIFQRGFWEYPELTLYFWVIAMCLVLTGIFVFKKLRPFFANVV
jgi:lipopolysaccharide transport system permease protein/teichoic acid transport system permease protein